jgi:uncharacterized protein YjlB
VLLYCTASNQNNQSQTRKVSFAAAATTTTTKVVDLASGTAMLPATEKQSKWGGGEPQNNFFSFHHFHLGAVEVV